MKRIFLLLIASSLILFVGCDKEDDPVASVPSDTYVVTTLGIYTDDPGECTGELTYEDDDGSFYDISCGISATLFDDGTAVLSSCGYDSDDTGTWEVSDDGIYYFLIID